MKNICCLSLLVTLLFSTLVFAQKEIVPIVELPHHGLLGGVQNGRWIAPVKVAPQLRTETEFLLVGWNGVEEGGVTIGKVAPTEEVCPEVTRFDLELEQDHGVAIGTAAKWNPVPRIPKAIDPNSAAYKTVVINFLRKKGIVRPIVRIKEAFRVDLEGDGVEEVVLSATYYKNELASNAAVGDYSFVIVRKAVGKIVTDHLLQGDFILKRVRFGAPTENHVSAIADLNGDGIMEIVLLGFYYEGDFSSAFEMKNGKPVKIKEFDIGCGV